MINIEGLKEENEALKKEIGSLKAHQKLVRVTREELAACQETQIRFRTIFKNSCLNDKIMGRDLKILQVNDTMLPFIILIVNLW